MADNINMRKQSDWRTKASGSRRKQKRYIFKLIL